MVSRPFLLFWPFGFHGSDHFGTYFQKKTAKKKKKKPTYDFDGLMGLGAAPRTAALEILLDAIGKFPASFSP
jgi:hypothetical protein